MRNFLFYGTVVVSLLFAKSGFAREHDHEHSNAPSMTPGVWIGAVVCGEDNHAKSHRSGDDCGLKFVEKKTGQEWAIKSGLTGEISHQNEIGLPVRIEGLKSPRYLLGGSFVEVKRIEVLNNRSKKPAVGG